jgi:hypothetical protein
MTSTCGVAQVYIHGSVTLKGTMTTGLDPAADRMSHVLFVVTSSGIVEIESGFNGVIIAPNGYIHAVPGQKHYGAFYGKSVYLEQDSQFHYRPFNGPLPVN